MIETRFYCIAPDLSPDEAARVATARAAFLARRAARAARVTESDRTIADMLARATPPEAMGAAPVAPARLGQAMQLCEEAGMIPGSELRTRLTGRYWRGMDRLSIMCRQAERRHGDSATEAAFVPPFTAGQVAIARHYATIVERHDAGGVRASSLELGRGGAGSGEFIDAYITLGREVARLRHAIGAREAMVVRRLRPSDRGSRTSIPDRRIVDMVCLGGATLSEVLEAHGWVTKGETRKAVLRALCAALDRMQGYREKGD